MRDTAHFAKCNKIYRSHGTALDVSELKYKELQNQKPRSPERLRHGKSITQCVRITLKVLPEDVYSFMLSPCRCVVLQVQIFDQIIVSPCRCAVLQVQIFDQIILESVKSPGQFLHASAAWKIDHFNIG